jgi:hypothetical protein
MVAVDVEVVMTINSTHRVRANQVQTTPVAAAVVAGIQVAELLKVVTAGLALL